MQRRAKSEDKWYELPKDVSFESTMIVFHYRNIKLLAFVPESEKKHIVLYLHGGAYVSQISKNQLRFCDRLAQQSDSVVLAPIYPLAPNHRFSETYLVLEHLYPDIRGYTDLPLTILGDSAGGRTCRRILRVSRRVGLGTAGAFDSHLPVAGCHAVQSGHQALCQA